MRRKKERKNDEFWVVVAGEKREAEHERGLERDEGRQEERSDVVSGDDDARFRAHDEHGAMVVDGDHAAVLADDFNAAEADEAVVAPGLEEENA